MKNYSIFSNNCILIIILFKIFFINYTYVILTKTNISSDAALIIQLCIDNIIYINQKRESYLTID